MKSDEWVREVMALAFLRAMESYHSKKDRLFENRFVRGFLVDQSNSRAVRLECKRRLSVTRVKKIHGSNHNYDWSPAEVLLISKST